MKKISEWGPADHLAEIIIVIAGLFFVYKISGWATSLVTFVFWLAVGAALDLSGVGSGLFVLIGAHVFVLIIAGALGILWRDKKDLSGQEFQTTMGALLQNRRHQRASTPIKRLRSRKNGAYSVRRGSKALRVASGDITLTAWPLISSQNTGEHRHVHSSALAWIDRRQPFRRHQN